MTHELKHALHELLGIEGRYSISDDLNSRMTEGLLPAPKKLPEIKKAPTRLLKGSWDYTMPLFMEVPEEMCARVIVMSLTYESFEEIWNIICFANVDGILYLNLMANSTYLGTPALHHGHDGKFKDYFEEMMLYSACDTDIKALLLAFAEEMDRIEAECLSELNPKPEAWAVWMALQGRSGVREFISTLQAKTDKDFLKKFAEAGLVGEE